MQNRNAPVNGPSAFDGDLRGAVAVAPRDPRRACLRRIGQPMRPRRTRCPATISASAAASTIPVNAQGSLRDWKRGTGINLAWENWQPGAHGVGRVGFGLDVAYSRLAARTRPVRRRFRARTDRHCGRRVGASRRFSRSTSNLRIRIPAPCVMPAITSASASSIGRRETSITHRPPARTGTASSHRAAALSSSLGGASIEQIYRSLRDLWRSGVRLRIHELRRAASRTPSEHVLHSGCDLLKNTTVGTLRGGLRVRLGR